MLLVFCNCSLYDSSHAFMKLFQISVDSRDKRSEREVILTISGRKPTRECGFFATEAARSIKSRIACGYEYTEVLRAFRRKIPARRSPTQDISPKKISKTHPTGQKKPGENLFSCYPEILLILFFLVCIIWYTGGTWKIGLNTSTRGVLADFSCSVALREARKLCTRSS